MNYRSFCPIVELVMKEMFKDEWGLLPKRDGIDFYTQDGRYAVEMKARMRGVARHFTIFVETTNRHYKNNLLQKRLVGDPPEFLHKFLIYETKIPIGGLQTKRDVKENLQFLKGYVTDYDFILGEKRKSNHIISVSLGSLESRVIKQNLDPLYFDFCSAGKRVPFYALGKNSEIFLREVLQNTNL